MKKLLIVLCLGLFLCGCKKSEPKISELEKLMMENDYVIVDVRTKDEYDEGHLVDAINIPYDEIDENVELDKEKLILVYCKSGNRSAVAYNMLINLGFNVYDMGAYIEIDLPKE